MKLLIGLGNPGPQYKYNRHNIGFQLVDFILSQPAYTSQIIKTDQQFNAHVIKLNNLIIAEPQEFMNRSGNATQKLMQFYKILPEDTYVAHDDLDIAIGKYKIIQRGPQIHNGIASIKETVGDTFWKIRIGIENRDPQNRLPGEAYVLQDFTQEETKTIQATFKEIVAQLTPLIL